MRALRELAGRWLLVLRLADAYNRCDEDRAKALNRELDRREYEHALARERLRDR